MTINPQPDLVAMAKSRCQKLLERIPQLAWLMTDRGQIIAVNQRWCDYMGGDDLVVTAGQSASLTRTNKVASLTGDVDVEPLQLFTDILHEEERDRFILVWATARRCQTPIEIGLRLKGLAAWEWFKLDLEPDDESEPTTWICTAVRWSRKAAMPRQSGRLLSSRDEAAEAIGAGDAVENLVLCDRMALSSGLSLEPVVPLQQAKSNDFWVDRTQILGSICDIGDFKCHEEALRRSEEFTRRVLESSQDCIKVIDLAGDIVYMNDGGQSLMEIDNFASIVNTKWSDFWQGREAQSAQTAIEVARAGGVGRFEGHCPTAKGTPKCWEVVVTPIQDVAGNVIQFLSVSRDITARKQAEIDLQMSEELFRHTFEYVSVGFCHVALDGTWLRVNQKLCEIVGYSAAELLATTFQAITEPADLAGDLALVKQLIAGEIGEYTLEKRYIHKQGHHVWVNLTVSLMRAGNFDGKVGAPKHFVAAIQDVTQRKQLEFLTQSQTDDLRDLNRSLLLAQQQLKDRNQELDAFVYTVSHDLKAPLRSISNLSEWIEEDLQDRLSDNERSQFAILRQRVQRMDALISGLLQYSRLGSQELEIHAIDLNRLVTETIDSLDPPAGLTIEIVSPLPTLPAKRILLVQIFANLIGNAIEHHDKPNGRIEIGVEDLGDCYRFSIADDGPGIPPGEDRHRIFDMFRTLKPSMSTKNTGIGLALVKKIVEGEGGRIWVAEETSSSPLAGACFYFTLAGK